METTFEQLEFGFYSIGQLPTMGYCFFSENNCLEFETYLN